jgi:hypothetical protein
MSNDLLYPMNRAASSNPANPVFQKDLIPLIGNLIDLNTSSVPVVINDSIEMTGTTANTTTTYMQYAYNVVTEATVSNYAARLPYPPVKGKSVVIINISGTPIVVYPSVTGGSINGIINGSALVPSDGVPYTFLCYENPLPGAWSWTPPATNQYDSGEIILTQSSVGGIISAANNSFITYDAQNSASTGIANNGISKALILVNTSDGVWFKPSSFWNNITKIKVYTNNAVNVSTVNVKISSQVSYYNISTGALTGSGVGLASDLISTTNIDSSVSGTFVPVTTDRSAFSGSDGTLYKEITVTPIAGVVGTIGDKYLGQVSVSGTIRDAYQVGYIKFIFNPNAIIDGADTRFRFFIEYN